MWHFFKEQNILIENIAYLTRKNGLKVLPNATLTCCAVTVASRLFQISATTGSSSMNWSGLDTNEPEL